MEPAWIRRLKKLPRVHPQQAHRISSLARELAQALAPDCYTGAPGQTPLQIAATELAQYLDGTWEFKKRVNPIPPPTGWDPQYACGLLRTAMYAFEAESIGNHPREPGPEREIRTLAYQLALEIAGAGWRNDPGRLLGQVVQGRGGQAPEQDRERLTSA